MPVDQIIKYFLCLICCKLFCLFGGNRTIIIDIHGHLPRSWASLFNVVLYFLNVNIVFANPSVRLALCLVLPAVYCSLD